MQPKIPLFSSPAIVELVATGDPSPVVALDLTEASDQQVTRLVTLYAQYTHEVPDGSSAEVTVVLDHGDPIVDTDFVSIKTILDTSSAPVKLLDNYPMRGDAKLLVVNTSAVAGSVFAFGYYTIGGTPGDRFNTFDKRALQPDNAVPEAFSVPVVCDLLGAAVDIHEVPVATARNTNSYIDEVTLDVFLNGSTVVSIFFEDFPDNVITIRPYTVVPPDNFNGLLRALDGIPFREQGKLQASAVTAGEETPASVSGFFMRY